MFPRPGGFVFRCIACVLSLCVSSLPADEAVQPSLTIYNQNFAVVRQELPLNLKAGVNKLQVTDITMHLEPDSVILRDPSGKHPIQVLEQNTVPTRFLSLCCFRSTRARRSISWCSARTSRRSSPAKSSVADTPLTTTWR